MKKEKRKKSYKVVIVLSIIMAGVLILAEGRAATPDYSSLGQNMALSIVCSIIASALFCLLQDAEDEDQEAKINNIETKLGDIAGKLDTERINNIEEGMKGINENLKRQRELYDSGIRSIRKKSFYDADGAFWKNIIASTSNRMDLIGHSISKWFDEEYKDAFAKKIEEMIKAGKEIRIILSGNPPDMEKVRLAEKNGKELCQLSKMENTCYELRKIVRNVPKTSKNKLKVYITDLSKVTYMYIRTDQQCFISPYIYSETNKSNSFLLELRTQIDYSKCFDDDFQEMLRNNPQKISLEE